MTAECNRLKLTDHRKLPKDFAMNLAEKIVGAYLRLNGFLLLPHFTVFNGNWHNHIDFLGVRMANSQESVDNTTFIIDENFFNSLSKILGRDARTICIGVASEVRTNAKKDKIDDGHAAYASRFLGGISLIRISFSDNTQTIELVETTLQIGVRYAAAWIIRRFDWMTEQGLKLTKSGSWELSEGFLSDLLVFYKYKLLTGARP